MRDFNLEHYLESGRAVMAKRAEAEAIAQAVTEKGYDNIVITAIGGTWARWYAVAHVMRRLTKVPVYLENSAELCLSLSKPFLTEKSLVLTGSNSGNTKEILEAAKMCRNLGATVYSFVEPESCPLKDLSDYCISVPLHYGEDIYLVMYLMGLSLLWARGDMEEYPAWADQMNQLHPAFVKVKEQFDPQAAEIAKKYHKAPYVLMTSSGILKEIGYWFCMCVLEEMQWIRANSVCSPDFFHGTLEVLEDGVPLFLVKGEDEFRPLDERVERFATQVCKDVVVFDTKEYPLEGIEDRFRIICSPMLIATMLSERLEVYLQLNTGHWLEFRRYYRQIEY